MDNFSTFPTTPISPARSGVAVIPNDTADLPHISRAVFIGAGGNLAVEMADGDQIVFEGLPSGSLLPIRVAKISSTATTAGSIIALW